MKTKGWRFHRMVHFLVGNLRCQHCNRLDFFRKQRMNTAFCDEARNWTRECPECFASTIDHYETLWAESQPTVLTELSRIEKGICLYADDTVWIGDGETAVDALQSLQSKICEMKPND